MVEFKQAGNDYDTDKIGEYFSALANEANLRGVELAWLLHGKLSDALTAEQKDDEVGNFLPSC